ncbi:ABC transporter permease [Sphingomonas naphthae]|uniref:ABC transporter permease n=1 Tax=Sphingomonas naphthae TaxID=1813468 RepID=A0ABY7TPJ4_9SPHN|nr:ABC transporter permease [Sphingomonas naphthae]WCT74850.1 ABC transporter permease [Sphingomonas naphthae]
MRVIGALTIRDLHSRFGRHNIGFLWMIGEPLLLATVIGIIHGAMASGHMSQGINPVMFGIHGYCTFIIFRGIFGRAEGLIEHNTTMLYHRHITILDIVWAKSVVEGVGCCATMFLLLAICVALGLGTLPERPLYLFASLGFMIWLSTGASMLVTAYTHKNHLLARMVHPFSYFQMPISGMGLAQDWMPSDIRDILWWNPMVHIMEMGRYGLFEVAKDDYFSFGYVALACSLLTIWGLRAINKVRASLSL